MQLPPIATTTVGSFPRPGWLAETRKSEVVFRLEGDLLREAQDDATLLVLHQQEQVGMDLLADGEQRRLHFIFHVLSYMDGFNVQNRHLKAIRGRDVATNLVPRVVGKVRRREPALVDHVRFAKAHTDRPVKMDVPGPMSVVDTTYDETYHDEAALAMDVAAALNQEILDLQAAGCDVVQIDEPAMTRLHQKVKAYGARALDRCLEGVTVPTIVHLCYGYPDPVQHRHHEHEYPELLEMLMQTRIGGFSLEFGRSQFPASVLERCEGRIIMYGCIDPGPSTPEPVEEVVARVREALAYVDPSKLWIAPDCGLITISRELARAKTELLVRVADQVRREV